MKTNRSITRDEKQGPVNDTLQQNSLAHRAGLFVVFFICALAIFLLAPNYYKAFPTNGSVIYAGILTLVFLAPAVWFKRSPGRSRYWQIAYAFFVASAVVLVSDLFAGYNTDIFRALKIPPGTNMELAVGKVYDTLLVVITILVLVKLSGADLGSLLIARGNLKWGLGIGFLVLFNFFTSVLIFFAPGYKDMSVLGAAIAWGAVFSFSNGFLEELWMRGLFVKKLVALLGVAGTVVLTSAWFSALHLLSVAYLPWSVIPIFLVNTFTLGIACGFLMIRTNSIWGPVLIHAAADWFLFIATLAIR